MKKPGTVIMAMTCFAFCGAAVCLQLAGSLAQWAADDSWPHPIHWTVILLTAAGTAFNSFLSFKSRTFSDWSQGQKNDIDNPVSPVVKPPSV